MLVKDYLRPAAVKAGILSSHRNDEGRLGDDDPRRSAPTDPKTVKTLLRHSDVRMTLQCYTHSISDDRMAAEGAMLIAILSHAARTGAD
jgi:integrase